MIKYAKNNKDKIDKIIEKIELYLIQLTEKKQLKKIKIEKCEWYTAPDILLSWQEDNLINRNIHILINDDGCQIQKIECNSWKDYQRKRKGFTLRAWKYQNIKENVNASDEAKIKNLLEIAYQTVSAWGENDLNEEPIYF